MVIEAAAPAKVLVEMSPDVAMLIAAQMANTAWEVLEQLGFNRDDPPSAMFARAAMMPDTAWYRVLLPSELGLVEGEALRPALAAIAIRTG